LKQLPYLVGCALRLGGSPTFSTAPFDNDFTRM
jgi:hypothetical protein